ncbi:MAG: 4Fe-4S binding protein [Coriobacteriales bacterium]|jgi:ferredoxin-type protein NapH|nr:4Fe-4S binding protein [Coriobacteriales bacterium]
MNSNRLRAIVVLAVMVLLTIGYITHLDFGTLSAVGWSTVSLICPLGALTTIVAAKLMIPRALITLVVVIILLVIFGRAFCAWVCPVPVVQKLRGLFSRKERGEIEASKPSGCTSCAKKRGAAWDSRHIILGGSVLSALIFGFPVFCLICPIGLTFASIFLIVNLFSAGDLTWTVVLAPLLLLGEVVFFRKWCAQICPLSAFMSLAAKKGRFFRPTIDDGKCLETTTNKPCGICGEVCPETIDPRHPNTSKSALNECTKCRVCVDNCPAQAIKLPIWAPKVTQSQSATPLTQEAQEAEGTEGAQGTEGARGAGSARGANKKS